MDNFINLIKILIITFLLSLIGYSIVGTSGRVEKIKELAPESISDRNWTILRYEGYQLGSWWNHGGKVWYHVANTDNKSIQYRVYVTLWENELHYHYGEPEVLNRIDLNYK